MSDRIGWKTFSMCSSRYSPRAPLVLKMVLSGSRAPLSLFLSGLISGAVFLTDYLLSRCRTSSSVSRQLGYGELKPCVSMVVSGVTTWLQPGTAFDLSLVRSYHFTAVASDFGLPLL